MKKYNYADYSIHYYYFFEDLKSIIVLYFDNHLEYLLGEQLPLHQYKTYCFQ